MYIIRTTRVQTVNNCSTNRSHVNYEVILKNVYAL